MARPDIREQRREQILDAFERCIALHGVAGAGLDMIAREAGLARALIRHNVGNRDDLLEAATHRFTRRTMEEWQETIAQLPEKRRYETLVDWLFDPRYSDPQLVRISDALITASAGEPSLADHVREWLTGFSLELSADIRDHTSGIETETCMAIATGILAIYFSYDSTSPLGKMDDHRRSCRQAALILAGQISA